MNPLNRPARLLIFPFVLIGLVAFGFLALNAQPAFSKPPAILLGTAWYPEQWPESRWDADLVLMQKAGIHMVRVGEFAWSRMEPTEGQYDLELSLIHISEPTRR